MEKILVLQNKHWNNSKYDIALNRLLLSKLIKNLRTKDIQVLLGIRRSGKSTLFKLLINYLINEIDPKSILYLNLDDPYFEESNHDAKFLYKILETAEKITQKKFDYLFLDEVQNIKNWEKFVKSIYDSELFKKIFVTGSNSALLSGNYASLLSGRYISNYVHPLSFSEILENNGIDSYLKMVDKKSFILGLMDKMLEYGSFPEVLKHQDVEFKRDIITSYFETIILKDCVSNNNIRDTKTFKELAHYLITNNATLYSYNGIADHLNSNENSIKQHIDILEECFLLKEMKNFSYSLATQSKSKKKTYCIDNGFLANLSFRFLENKGVLFENLVYTELLKSNFELFFYNDIKECDFIAKEKNRITAIQACYELNEKNRERELNGLKITFEKLKIKNGIIITYDQEEKVDNKIEIISFRKYFGNKKI